MGFLSAMKKILRLLAPVLVLLAAALGGAGSMGALANNAAAGTALIMVEEHGCPWCVRWSEEIGVVYPKTAEGQMAPLRRVDVHTRMPTDLAFLKPVYFTPTFVLISDGREVGRIQGYPGEDFFWALLQELLAKLPNQAVPLKVEASR